MAQLSKTKSVKSIKSVEVFPEKSNEKGRLSHLPSMRRSMYILQLRDVEEAKVGAPIYPSLKQIKGIIPTAMSSVLKKILTSVVSYASSIILTLLC